MLDPTGPVVAILSAGEDEATLSAGLGLAGELASTGTSVALLDFGARLSRSGMQESGNGVFPASVDAPIAAFGCTSGNPAASLSELRACYDAVLVLAPPLSSNLVVLHSILKEATARVVLLRAGKVTRADAARVLLAERGTPARRVLVLAN